MSICAFDSNEQLIYPKQCVNFAGPFTGGITNFIPVSLYTSRLVKTESILRQKWTLRMMNLTSI